AAPHAVGGLAELGLPDRRGQAVLCGNVLPARGPPRPPGLPAGPGRAPRGLAAPEGRRPEAGGRHRRGHPGAPPVGRGRRRGASPRRGRRRGPACARLAVRPAERGIRRSAQVPLAVEPLLPAGPRGGRRRGPGDAGHDPRAHGARRDPRPARRRLPPLLHGCGVARAPLREDGLPPSPAPPPLPPGPPTTTPPPPPPP